MLPIPPGTMLLSSSISSFPRTSTLTGKSSIRALVRVLEIITSSKTRGDNFVVIDSSNSASESCMVFLIYPTADKIIL